MGCGKAIFNAKLLNEPCGIQGPTLLAYMIANIFAAISIDSLHCIYLGAVKQILGLLFDHAYHKEPLSDHSKIDTVNKRIHELTPPHFLQRTPQTIDKLIYYNGTELRSFLCILSDILADEYLENC